MFAMNDIARIDEFLQLMCTIATYKEINNDIVYANLVHMGAVREDINYMFQKWIDDFYDNEHIQVYVQDNWKYFCQFRSDKNFTLSNSIKMYIPLDSQHIYDGARMLFNYLSLNNIRHASKIAKVTRFDDIVLRVDNIDSVNKIRDFVLSNSYIREGLISPNPFAFNDGYISYAWDGHLSYNMIVSTYIANYINALSREGNLNKASYLELVTFIKNNYKQVFIDNVSSTEDFINFMDIWDEEEEVMQRNLDDCKKITEVLLKALMPDKKMDDFYQEYNKIVMPNDTLYDTIYVSMLQKYGDYNEVNERLLAYLKDNNINYFSRNANGLNLRKLVIDNGLTSEKFAQVIMNTNNSHNLDKNLSTDSHGMLRKYKDMLRERLIMENNSYNIVRR